MEVVDVREKDFVMINDQKVVKRKMWGKDSSKLENGISIHLDGSFGCYQTPIRKNTYFCTDDTLIYSCGNHLVLYDVVRKKQKYIMKNIEDQPLTAMNYFTNSRGEISVAVALKSKSDTLPQVKVYNSSKSFNYSLVHNLQNSIILDTAFILKSKFLITLTGMNKGFMANIYKIQKEKLACFIQIEDSEAKKIEVLDKGQAEFLIYGKTFCKAYSFDYQGLVIDEKHDLWALLTEAIGEDTTEQISECVWIMETNTIVIASFSNKLFLFKDFKYISTTEIELFEKDSLLAGRNSKQSAQEQERLAAQILEQQKQMAKSISVSCMAKLSRGVAIGFQGAAMLSLYELDSTDKILVHRGNFRMKEDNIQKIHSIDIAPDDMYAVINVLFFQRGSHTTLKVRSDGVFATLEDEKKEQLGKLEIYMFNLAVVDAIRTVQKDPYEALFDQGVHKGSVLDLGICPTRSFLVSVCEDKTVKFIDFGADFRELISQFFHESPLSVSIHPLSVQCAIGFKDGLKIFCILDDELKNVFTNNTKPCTAISYSNGGHLLAAANSSMVTIYNPYELVVLYQLNGHAAALKSLEWMDNDQKLISTCQNGVLNVWDIQTGSRLVEHAYKTHKLNAVTYDHQYDLVVCACADSKLRIFKEKGQVQTCEYETSPCQFTAISIDKRFEVIIFGTSEGSVRIYLWPFWTNQSKLMEYLEIPIHQCSITSIKISNDYQFLITASEDNSIFFSKIREYVEGEDVTASDLISQLNPGKDQNYNSNIDKITSAYSLNTLCLCSMVSQETKKESIKELEFRLQNSKSDIEDEKEKWEDIYSQRIKTLKEKHGDSKQKQKVNLTNIYSDHEVKFNELKEKISNQKADNEEEQEILNEQCSKELLSCYATKDKLMEECLGLKKKYAIQLDQAHNQFGSTMKKVQDEYDSKFGEIFNKYREALENVNNDQKKFHEVLSQQEGDFDAFFTSTKENLKSELQEEINKTEELRSSNSKFNKEIQNYRERQVYLTYESEQLSQEIESLLLDKQSFTEKNEIMGKQLSEKEDIINLREQQVKDLRGKNIHLQNFQKVYDYQVNTLKDERLPLKEHLTNMEKHVKNLYNELLEEAGTNKKIDKDNKKRFEQTKELKKQLTDKQNIVRQTTRLVENFEFQILDMLRNAKFEEWPKRLMNVYNEYFSGATRLEKVIEQSVIGANLKELKKDQFLEQMEQEQQYLIGQDLKGQRDFLARQLVNVAGDYRQVMESRNDAYLKVQNMNTLLINECNKMREEKSKLKEYLGVQKKAYREVKRQLATHLNINFNDLEDDDNFPDLIDVEEDQEDMENDAENERRTDNFVGQQQDLLGFKGMSIVQAQDDEESEKLEFQKEIKDTLEQQDVAEINQLPIQNDTQASPLKKQNVILTNQSVITQSISKPALQPLKNFSKNRVLKKQSELPFVAYQNKLEKRRAQTSQKRLKPLSVTEKKQNEKQLISDLLRQIEDINNNEESINSEDKMKDRVQSFLINERKDTVGPLIQKEPPVPIKTASTNYRSRKQVSQQSRNPISPPASASKASTQTGFMQTVSSNLGGFSSTGADFFRRPIQSSQSTQK